MFQTLLQVLTLVYLFFLHRSIIKLQHEFAVFNTNSYNDRENVASTLILQKLALVFGGRNAIATVFTILITLLNIIVYKLRQLQEAGLVEESDIPLCRRFSLAEIQLATHNFDRALVIGEGGFGKVYKGFIDNGATTVAIKRLDSESIQGAPEFRMEVEMLSKVRHTSIVSLIGYCSEQGEMIIVYEYMAYGSLADYLYKTDATGNPNNSTLSWVQLLRICIGAARGLDYLHTGAKIRIIHRDVKPTNILLDKDWGAKISDFGLSKLGPANQHQSTTHVSTVVKGTMGYLDPEYFLSQRLTWKSDVYGFGVVLFEVLCGRRAVDLRFSGEQRYLVRWAQHCIKDGTLDQIVNPILAGQILPDSLKMFEQIASQCLNIHSKKRPTMDNVVVSLTLSLSLQERMSSSIFHRNILNAPMTFDEEQHFSMEHPLVINYGNNGHHGGEEQNIPLSLQSEQLCHQFTLADIKSATNNFDEAFVIGKGGFGNVYKGLINNGNITVAIKRLNPTSKQGAPEFWNEIAMLSKIRHSHIITLIGYCHDQEEMILVYEYMIHGTLKDHLHKIGKNGINYTLSWLQRLKICIGSAHGLNHLHTGMDVEQRVIHRDVKSSNILLDGNWAAKISDFGLSKIGPANQPSTHVTTEFKGTSGYMDYDYFVTHHLTRKSDVYAFGVVLFEMLCGRPALDVKLNVEQRLLAAWAQKCINEGTLDQIIDPILTGQIFSGTLEVFKQIAVQCLHSIPTERPTMAEVVVSLERALTLQMRSDFSMLEEDFFNAGSSYNNQENENFYMKQKDISKADSSKEQLEIINACDGRQEEVKRSMTMTFTRKARQFLFGTSLVTLDMNQDKDFQSHKTNLLGPSKENSKTSKRKGRGAATLKRLII